MEDHLKDITTEFIYYLWSMGYALKMSIFIKAANVYTLMRL